MSSRRTSTGGGGQAWPAYLAAAVLLAVACRQGQAYDQTTHAWVVGYSFNCFNQFRPDREPGTYISWIEAGARHEDDYDHVWHYGQPDVTGTHFWNADAGPLARVILPPSPNVFPNAYQKATGYGVTNGALWQQAKAYYAAGDKANAYERLGHICHLIADMSVPVHCHNTTHILGDYYEDFMEHNHALVLPFMDASQLNQGLLPIPEEFNHEPGGPDYFDVLFYLMYTTNQRADYFGASADFLVTGNIYEPTGLVSYVGWDPPMGYYQDPDHVDTPLYRCPTCGRLGAPGGPGLPCYYDGTPMLPDAPSAIIAERFTTVYAVRATATLLDYWDQTMVPEPGCLALMGIGAATLLGRRRR